MARSTLELLLDSIKDRDEEPPDHLPALPQRPTSRARLPSRKRTSALLLTEPSFEQPHGHIKEQTLHAFDASKHHSNGHRYPESPPVLTSAENFSTATQNGHEKETKNGNQPAQDHTPVKAAVSHTLKPEMVSSTTIENRFSDIGDLVEPVLPSKEQASSTSDYFSLRKRRRVHHLHGLQKESRIWILNKENTWVLGNIQSGGDSEMVGCVADGQLLEVPPECLLPANPEFLDEVDDLVQLSFIHDPAVFHVLRRRYELGMYCTRAGSSLLVFTPPEENPFQKRSNSLKQSPLEALYSMGVGSEQPHIYRVVDKAYAFMTRDWKNQSIIIGGQCFAGKTQSAKAVLKHLVSHGKNDELGNTLLTSNLVLEAFGNAVIGKNASASRHGKLIDVLFDKEGNLCSAHVDIVFLEKSRVVCRAEHSYHVFYQLCEGADSSLREKLNLREGLQFNYLKCSESVSGAHPYLDFQSLLNALHSLGFTEKNQQDIFSLLGGILWLGNITSAQVENNEAVDNAATLLKCPKKDLIEALDFGGSNLEDVCTARDALACAIYEGLLNWLVAQINKALKPKTASDLKSITIVDVPAFGVIKSDGLESLLANYAQERLQCFSRLHLLQQEEEVASCGRGSYTVNSARDEENICFLENELLPFLVNHENCISLDQSELSFKRRMERLLTGKSTSKQSSSDTLTVAHAFGEATYNVGSLFKEMRALSKPRTREMLHSCMTTLLEMPENNGSRPSWNGSSEESLLRGPLLNGQERVVEMMEHLDDTEPHFIFCLAPSESKLTGSLEQGYVIWQLSINKVNEAVRLCRSGNFIYISHQHFASRYGPLLGSGIKKVNGPLDISVAVLHRLQVPPYMYKVGWTRVFICPEQVDRLEHARKQLLTKIIEIQKTFRGHSLRKQLDRERKAVTCVQAFVRGWLVRRGFLPQFGSMAEMGNHVHEHKGGPQPVSEHAKKVVGPSQDSLEGRDCLGQEEADVFMSNGGLLVHMQQEENITDKRNYNMQKEPVSTLSDKEQTHPADSELALKEKEEEIMILQQSVKEYERKWLAYEVKMKSMEDMWQKQVSFLEHRLNAATKGSNTEESAYKAGDSDKGVVLSTPPHGASARDTPETTIGDPDVTITKNENDPSRSALDHLSKEFEHRTQIFNDDAKFLVEVKSGQIEANFKPDEELQKLRQRFEVWKKDYKGRLKETKSILKKLGKGDATEKNRKRWWSKK